MPELKPLPCPNCGTTFVHILSGEDEITHEVYSQVRCKCCGMCAPEIFAEGSEAIAAWNALPRALRWATEPPRVAGFYFLKMASGTISMVYLSEQDIRDKDWHGCVGQWVAIAGPIPAPLD